ncbi:MAG: SDR family oxidoreductase [Candidatus Latescibacteria bacterium]|nr:SDR family oxidoreductase [Candidatus Latescibacterota bacterium]
MSSELFDLSGKVAVVIGGARDLGRDMAESLAEAGCQLALTSRREAAAQTTAQQLEKTYGCQTYSAALDICDYQALSQFAQDVRQWQGRIDVVVNNAGGGLGLSSTDFFARSPEDTRQLIDTNLTGPLFACQIFGRIMAEQGSGSIINIASIAGLVGRDRRMYDDTGLGQQPVDYAAAKAGVIGLTMDAAAYLAPMGVRVNAISPGGFERGQPQAFIDAYSRATALGRMGRDGIDLKGAVRFLAAPAADYITGHNLVVDGGFCMWK